MNELSQLRAELDALDRELVGLFEKRIALARQVARYKRSHGLPVLDAVREEEVLSSRVAMLTDPTLAWDVRTLFETLLALSRKEQQTWLEEAHGDA